VWLAYRLDLHRYDAGHRIFEVAIMIHSRSQAPAWDRTASYSGQFGMAFFADKWPGLQPSFLPLTQTQAGGPGLGK